ncbi:exonuclease subunit SbcD [Streptacidiphilus monticola]
MKFLHTSDWHVGKTLKGRNRLEEQAGVLREITQIAVGNDVDAVLIAGDLYENAAPTADAQRLVVRTLLQLAKQDIEVVLIAGNHDHGATLEAYKPLMDIAGIHVYGQARPAARAACTASTPSPPTSASTSPFCRFSPSATPSAPRRSSPTPRPRTPAPTTSSSVMSWTT